MVQGNLAGVRVVRSFALETRELHRFQQANKEYLDASLGLARLRGSMGPLHRQHRGARDARSLWYGGQLSSTGRKHGGLTKGSSSRSGSAMGRMTWPMIALGFVAGHRATRACRYSRLRRSSTQSRRSSTGRTGAGAMDGTLRVTGSSWRTASARCWMT